MLANMKIIVLPAYNAAETLNQTDDEIPYDIVDEIILIDDVSKDATVATCAATPSARSLHCRPMRLRIHRHAGRWDSVCLDTSADPLRWILLGIGGAATLVLTVA
jgi:hypothetical protein